MSSCLVKENFCIWQRFSARMVSGNLNVTFKKRASKKVARKVVSL